MSRHTRLGPQTAQYVGSATCKTCHAGVYARWQKTRVANIVVAPKHPEAIVPDFSTPAPLVTFTNNDIAFTYGSKWKQRYFKKVGDDYFPLARSMGCDPQDLAAYMGAPATEMSGSRTTRPIP